MEKTASQIADIVLAKVAQDLVDVKEDIPWLTSAAGGTLGALAGTAIAKNPLVGAALGSMAGTIPGLYTGKLIGRALDKKQPTPQPQAQPQATQPAQPPQQAQPAQPRPVQPVQPRTGVIQR